MADCKPSFLHKHPATHMDDDEDDDDGGEGEGEIERGNGMNWIGSVSELTTSEYIYQGPCCQISLHQLITV